MKKTLLLLLMAVIGLNVYAEKQIYGKVEYQSWCIDYSFMKGEGDSYEPRTESAYKLTVYYGELPSEEVYLIDKKTGIPQWKGLTFDKLGIKDDYLYSDIYKGCLSLLYFDESMRDADLISVSHWCEDMSELKYVYGIENLNMANVTDMSYMFAGCSSLRCVDISNFKFTSLTNTSNMFLGCESMSYINTPKSLSNVNNERMFYGVGNRTKPCYIETPDGYDYRVDISGPYFTYLSGYFVNCNKERYSVNFNFQTSTLWISSRLIYDKKRMYLKQLSAYANIIDYDSWLGRYEFFLVKHNFNNYDDDFVLFNIEVNNSSDPVIPEGGGNGLVLTRIDIDSTYYDYRPQSLHNYFSDIFDNNCGLVFESIYISEGSLRESSYYNPYDDFYNYKMVKPYKGLNFINTTEVADMSGMFSGALILDWDFANFDTSSATDMSSMFRNSYYSELDLTHINTSKVTNMSQMFSGSCFLKSLDLSNFNTTNVIDMSKMFCFEKLENEGREPHQPNLTNLDISNFDMRNVIKSDSMLFGCSSLHNLWISPTMNKLEEGACEGVGTIENPCIIYAPEGFDFSVDTSGEYFIWKGGFFRLPQASFPYAILSFDKKTLTFRYDNRKSDNEGQSFLLNDISSSPEWLENNNEITKVVFDRSFQKARPKTTQSWFDGMANLQSIEGLENLNTSDAVSFCRMFSGCAKVQNLDLNSFITSNLTNINNMFDGCSSLSSLNLKNFDVSKLSNLNCLFQGCSNLLTLDLSSFDTSNITTMANMFNGCSSLTTLDISSFDTSNVIDITEMFKGCSSLTSLDLSNFTIGAKTKTGGMLSDCSSLKGLFISPTMNLLEPDACLGVGTSTSPCQIKAPSGFDFGVSTTGDYFQWKGGYFAMTAEEYANISADGTTITFYCDDNRGSRQGTTYAIDGTASTPEWSANAATITKAVFDPSFAFARPTTTQRWFSGMKNLKTIEGIENLNTSDVTIMSYMFLNCQSLETLDLSHFDTRKVDKMGYMLQGCTNLKSVNLTGFETSACTSFYQMFKNCSSLESLDLSPLTITEGVESRYMLNGCTVLKNLTIPETAANLNNSSFVTVGTSDAPSELHAPEGFDFGIDTNGTFQWKSGWFYLAVPAALTATVASLSPGSTASMAVNMTNGAATSYNGYEMVLTLPEGMALAKSGSHFDCTLGDRYSANDFSVSINDLGGGAYRIIGFSLSNTTVTGSDGPLFLLKVTCPEGVATGNYTGTLEDISLSTTAGTGEEPEDVTFPITVSEYRLGDVDLNGKVNVVDVMLVVNRVLGETAANYHDEYADMDGNGKVNVVDIMTIIDVILTSPRTAPMPLTAMTNYNSHLILSPATADTTSGTILSLDGSERFTACQMDIRLDGSTTLRGIKLLGTNASTHSVKYFHVGDDLWRVVVYSTKGAALESNAPLLQLITNGSQHASIENIEMCNTAFDTVTLDCMEGSATAIAGTATDADAQQVPTYTIQGIRTDQPQRGVNIRNGLKVTVK